MRAKVSNGVRGRYAYMVINPDGSLAQSAPMKPNSIFNSGMSRIITNTWASAFTHCRIGTSATAVAPSASNNLVAHHSSHASYFTDTHVNPPSLVDGAGCRTTSDQNKLILRRTFDFAPLVAATLTVREIGFGWDAANANNLFSRVIPTPEVILLSGQVLRIIYELEISMSPKDDTEGAKLSAVDNWASSHGHGRIQNFCLASVEANGSVNPFGFNDSGLTNEPSSAADIKRFFISDSNATLSAVGGAPDLSPSNILSSVMTGHTAASNDGTTWTLKHRGLIPANVSMNGVRMFGVGLESIPTIDSSAAYIFKFDSVTFDKEIDYILNVIFTYSWSRL